MNYTAKKINPLGDFDNKYGQRYWGAVNESAMPVSFNLMTPINISEGAELEFEEKVVKESKKGTEYMFLRKVKVSGNSATEIVKTESKNIEQKLDAIAGDVKLLLSFVRQLQKESTKTQEPEPEEDNVTEDIGDEPMDLSQIPF